MPRRERTAQHSNLDAHQTEVRSGTEPAWTPRGNVSARQHTCFEREKRPCMGMPLGAEGGTHSRPPASGRRRPG